MFSYIKSYFQGSKINKDLVKSHIDIISKTTDYDKLKDTFEQLLPNIPLDNTYSIDEYNQLFAEFEHEQINNFSNNLCTLIEQQMKDTYEFLNNNNGSKFLNVSNPEDLHVEVADGHASLLSHQNGWEYQTYEDTILSGDSDNGIFVGKNAEVFFMDEEEQADEEDGCHRRDCPQGNHPCRRVGFLLRFVHAAHG
jgi:hypothetical protein